MELLARHLNKKALNIGGLKNKIQTAKCYDILNIIFYPEFGAYNFPLKTYKNIDFEKYFMKLITRKPSNNTTGYRGGLVKIR